MSTTFLSVIALGITATLVIAVLAGLRAVALRATGRRHLELELAPQQLWTISLPHITWRRVIKWVLFINMGAALLVALLRFAFGIGAVSHLSNQFPWGLWIGFDVMGGVALAAGAFVVAGLAHIFGVHRLEPLVRPAILTGFLGYLLVIFGLVIDLGRPYNIWRPLISFQHHSVMWEVGLCVATYTTVLFIEFLPVILERVNRFERVARKLHTHGLYRLLRKISIVFVILGVILSTLHQSSLGSLWVLLPSKLYPLWYSIYLPVFFWLSAVAVGFAMTIVESTLSAKVFRHGLHVSLLSDLAKWSMWVLVVYFVARMADLVQRQALSLAFQPTIQAAAFWLEMGLGVIVPVIIFSIPRLRQRPRWLFTGALLIVVFGIVLNRLNITLVGMWPWAGVRYLPSLTEIIITLGIVSFGLYLFTMAVKYLPVFEPESAD